MRSEYKLLPVVCMSVLLTVSQAFAPPSFANDLAPPNMPLPKGKQTPFGLYLSPREAAEMMHADGHRTLFIDVRTRGELLFTGWTSMIDGHVPLADVTETWEWDDKEGRYEFKANPTFSQDVQRLLAAKGLTKSDRVIVMCRSGERSARAIEKLAEAGFTNLYNQYEGFEGDLSRDGRRTINGWKNTGLPWNYKPEKAKFYQRRS